MTRTLLSWPSRERNVVPSSILRPHHLRHQVLRHLAVCGVAAAWALARNRRWHQALRLRPSLCAVPHNRQGEAHSVT